MDPLLNWNFEQITERIFKIKIIWKKFKIVYLNICLSVTSWILVKSAILNIPFDFYWRDALISINNFIILKILLVVYFKF